ncbi:hypothetical protein LTR62_001745 [Meristemomyces frigidus]|uniref:Uncharacterized protein n=1 Tax=Meristemomyces frigidus TaxID=1508187 RepID=A0AAN7TH49_9PEZI|nr:hypothetical protein LTR62_001745 [Meristemomyces frigidus]
MQTNDKESKKKAGKDAFRVQKASQQQSSIAAAAARTAGAVRASSTSNATATPGTATTTVTEPSTWIDFNAVTTDRSRKDVRAQAARASAAARRATLAKKAAKQAGQPGSLVFALTSGPVKAGPIKVSNPQRLSAPSTKISPPKDPSSSTILPPTTAEQAVAVVQHGLPSSYQQISPDQLYFQQTVDIVTQFLDHRPTSVSAKGEVSMAHSSIRSMLWNAMTCNTTLFQVSLFLAGTYSNTCGLPRQALRHLGPGLTILRGASLEAIQERITPGSGESIAPVAIALLAGWERRYGDQESYEVHMRAWKALAIPGRSLEEQNVSTLTDLALEMYLDSLGEAGQQTQSMGWLSHLPAGFRIFDMSKVEMRSLLTLVAQMALFEPHSKTEPARLRHIALENMSWSPTHTHGYENVLDFEDEYEPLVLSALYHIRAANITICGILLQHTMDIHNITWNFDMRGGMAIHTSSCRHLQTEMLMGTRFEYIAIWARFSLCAVSRDEEQDAMLIGMLQRLNVRTWSHLKAILSCFLYEEGLMGGFCEGLFHLLTENPLWRPQGFGIYPTQGIRITEIIH